MAISCRALNMLSELFVWAAEDEEVEAAEDEEDDVEELDMFCWLDGLAVLKCCERGDSEELFWVGLLVGMVIGGKLLEPSMNPVIS